jgi:uncharacterized protein YabN with tetrapyrrole methylase and pyrophosphatase domain
MTPTTDASAAFARLVDLVRVLRSPGGCPWDREQTLQSLRPFVLEETYEVLEALDHDDRHALREELGDFIFEGVLLAQLCTEAGDFTVADSLHAISDKLVRRHPHVFGPQDGSTRADARPLPTTPDEVVERWEDLKAREKSTSGEQRTALGGVPKSLPALLRTVAKIEEEVAELREWVVGAGAAGNGERAEEEMGDLLFAIANLSRKLGIEPESALRKANDKFSRRFSRMESRLRAAGRPLSECTLQEMEDEWSRVKQAEREAPAGPDAASVAGR